MRRSIDLHGISQGLVDLVALVEDVVEIELVLAHGERRK